MADTKLSHDSRPPSSSIRTSPIEQRNGHPRFDTTTTTEKNVDASRPSTAISGRAAVPARTKFGPTGPPGPPGGWLSHKMSTSQEIAFNLMICTVQLIPQACLTTCFSILDHIALTFKIEDPSLLPWLVAAYVLSFGTTILLAGRLGDIFGHKLMVIIGFCWMSLFSVIGGLSHYTRYELFFVARALQGVGAAIMNPNALALLGRSYPPGSTGKIIAFSAFALCAPLGAYSGMLGSAIIGQLWFWPWAFYITAMICAFLAVSAIFILPNPPKSPKQMLPFGQKLASMDWLGGLTGVSGLVCVQVALVCAPTAGWQTQYVFMLFIIGLILVSLFLLVEFKVASEPLVPFKLLNGTVAFVLAAIACGWGTFGVWTFYIWKFFLNVWHDTPLKAALHALPIVPVALVAAALTAVLMRTVRPAWILFWALVAFTLGPMFLAFNHAHTNYWALTFVSLVLTPFGMDMSFPAATFIMSNSLPMDKQGVAGSLIITVINYSISLGLGFASTVEVHVNDNGKNLLDGIRGAWFFGIGLGALGIVVCILFIFKTNRDTRKRSFISLATLVPNTLPTAETKEPNATDTSASTTPNNEMSRTSTMVRRDQPSPLPGAPPRCASRTYTVASRDGPDHASARQSSSYSTDVEPPVFNYGHNRQQAHQSV